MSVGVLPRFTDGPNPYPVLNQSSWLADDLWGWFPHFDGRWVDHGPQKLGECALVAASPVAISQSPFGPLACDFAAQQAEFSMTNGVDRLASIPAFTVSFWAYLSAYGGNHNAISLYDDADPTDPNTLFQVLPNDNFVDNGCRVFWDGSNPLNDSSDTVALNQWHHYIITSRSATNHELYVDRISKHAQVVQSKTLSSLTSRLSIGHWNSTQSGDFPLFGITIHTRGMDQSDVDRWYWQDRWDLYAPRTKLLSVGSPAAAAKPSVVRIDVAWEQKPPAYTPFRTDGIAGKLSFVQPVWPDQRQINFDVPSTDWTAGRWTLEGDTTPFIDVQPGGMCLNNIGHNRGRLDSGGNDRNADDYTNGMTVLTVVQPFDVTSGHAVGQQGCTIFLGGTGVIRNALWGATEFLDSDANVYAADDLLVIACAADQGGAGTTKRRTALNGRLVASENDGTHEAVGTDLDWQYGNGGGGSTEADGFHYFMAVFNGMLSDAELVEVTANPWATLFAPQTRLISTLAPAAAVKAGVVPIWR